MTDYDSRAAGDTSATEPSWPAAGPKRYRVPDHVNHIVLGHWPGEEFEAEIPPKQEARLLSSGALELVDGESQEQPAAPDQQEPDAAGDGANSDPKGE